MAAEGRARRTMVTKTMSETIMSNQDGCAMVSIALSVAVGQCSVVRNAALSY
jgi:hypothetical protein